MPPNSKHLIHKLEWRVVFNKYSTMSPTETSRYSHVKIDGIRNSMHVVCVEVYRVVGINVQCFLIINISYPGGQGEGRHVSQTEGK